MNMWICKFMCNNLISYVSSSILHYRSQYQTHFSINHSPEALGIVPGAIFLICLMFCLVGFATNHPQKVRTTSLFHPRPGHIHHLIHYSTLSCIL